ncbi:actin-like ATPase domain-containing protein [Ramicandelaber brevisporus]|nr:actin-like ATPase domain-containing protein [Ramicandelaber brevisporus]
MTRRQIFSITEAERQIPFPRPLREQFPLPSVQSPFVIDLGSYRCRAGWSAESAPSLEFSNVLSKFRERRAGQGGSGPTCVLVGDDIILDASVTSNMKPVFEMGSVIGGGTGTNVNNAGSGSASLSAAAASGAGIGNGAGSGLVANPDAVENVFDYIFARHGLGSSGSVQAPLLITEPAFNLPSSRRIMSELIFEAYNAPSLTYGVDGLFAFQHEVGVKYNDQNGGSMFGKRSGLVVSLGHSATHILPILGDDDLNDKDATFSSNGDSANSFIDYGRRISYGGAHATEFMSRLMQLKYPVFPAKISPIQAEYLVNNHTFVSLDYQSELNKLAQPEGISELDVIIEYPHPQMHRQPPKSSEELEAEAEKRREQGRRLQELIAKQREEKQRQREADLNELQAYYSTKELDPAEFARTLVANGWEDEADLLAAIKELTAQVNKGKSKQATAPAEDGVSEPMDVVDSTDALPTVDGLDSVDPTTITITTATPTATPAAATSTAGADTAASVAASVADDDAALYPLLAIPDDQLTQEQIKEKRRQRLLKIGAEQRAKNRAAKEEERRKAEEAARQDEERRLADPVAYVEDLKRQRQAILDKMAERERRRKQVMDRRGAAAQKRMKSIANLASSENDTTVYGNKRRRRRDQLNDTGPQREDGEDDGFGLNDDDWAVYREINKDEPIEDEEVLAAEAAELERIKTLLDTHAPGFLEQEQLDKYFAQQENSLIYRLKYGYRSRELLMNDETKDGLRWTPDYEDYEQSFRLHANIERIRVPEVYFEPCIAGFDQAGIVEIIESMLLRGSIPLSVNQRNAILSNVIVTGGPSALPGFTERLQQDLVAAFPAGQVINVTRASSPSSAAWRGAASWATHCRDEFDAASISRAQFQEFGGEYIKDHRYGNRFYNII